MWSSLVISALAAMAFVDSAFAAKKCNAKGVQWAFFNNTASARDTVADYPAFDPTAYKTVKPIYQSVTSLVGGAFTLGQEGNPALISVYGSGNKFSRDNFTLNHQGYLHAQETGIYTFLVNRTDDITFIWTGKKAYTAYTRANADCSAIYNYPTFSFGNCTKTFSMTKGQYMPFRIIYGQGDYDGSSDIFLTSPSGKMLLDYSTGYTNAIVQYGCGKHATLAPKFPAFGSQG